MGGCTTQTTLIDVVHGGMCTWRSSRPSPLRRAGYTNDAAVTESSSAQAAIVRCLYDVHQQSICRPKDPGNGDNTTIGFNWRCKGLAAYCNRAKKWPKNVVSIVPFTSWCGNCGDRRRARTRSRLTQLLGVFHTRRTCSQSVLFIEVVRNHCAIAFFPVGIHLRISDE